MSTLTGLRVTGLEGAVRLGSRELEQLAGRLDGAVLRSGDDDWPEAVEIWNAMAQRTPALVVQPVSAADVATTVDFARSHGLLLSVKGGGHNIGGTAIAPGGLTLDMSRLREVVVDPDTRLAHVGAGCLLRHVDAATQQHGLATTLGFVSETGVAGLTLGGGFGYLARRFGWTADNLEQVEVVTADGRVRIADRDHHPDLFWGLRGGGGNLGVVTRFTFRLHEVGPTVVGGLVAWDGARADEVLAAYRELTSTLPRHCTVAAVVRQAPPAPFVPRRWHGRPVAGMLICHSGPDPDADLAPLRELGEPVFDVVGPRPYTAQQSLLDDSEPRGMHQYWKAEFLPEVSPEYLDTFRDAALDVASPMSFSVIFHLAGAVNDRAPDDGAVGNRDAHFISGFSGAWAPGAPEGQDVVRAVRAGWHRIRPFSTGGNYVNFHLAEDGEDRTAAAYGGNLARLQQVKAAWDPANLFRVNRNVSPAARELTE